LPYFSGTRFLLSTQMSQFGSTKSHRNELATRCNCKYIVGHKNAPLYFSTPAFRGEFLHYVYAPMETRINTLQNRNKIFNVTLSVFSVAAMQFGMTVVDGFLQCVRSHYLYEAFVESHPMFIFIIFVNVFPDASLGINSFRFPHVLIKILTYFHIPFHCIIITHEVTQ